MVDDVNLHKRVRIATNQAGDVTRRARATRTQLARHSRRDNVERRTTIALRIEEINDAMKPVRSLLGKGQYGRLDNREYALLAEASRRLQAERRSLRRML